MPRWNGHLAWGRGGAAIASLLVHLILIAALIWGLQFKSKRPQEYDPALVVVTTLEAPPKPQPEPVREPGDPERRSPAPEGLEAEAAPLEAPQSGITLVPEMTATATGDGQENRSGAGSAGSGTGAGGTGDGDSSGGIATAARRITGELRDSDYPRSAERQGLAGMVVISFVVRTDGLVDRCAVTASSGHAVLDDLTCRLFTERFRFEPARTAAGRAIDSTLRTSFTWSTRRR